MNLNEILILIIFLTALSLFSLSILISKARYRKHLKFVLDHSPKFEKIRKLNQRYSFSPCASSYEYTKKCTSKSNFDKTDSERLFLTYLIANCEQYRQLIETIQDNRKHMEGYSVHFDHIMDSDISSEFHAQYRFFRDIENDLCMGAKASPALELTLKIRCIYKYHKKIRRYRFQDLEQMLGKIEKQYPLKNTKSEERSKMTASLRYDIIKRDGFCCVLCGRSAKDGIKLHVDHIVPVSKGGKTIKSNLRTLCESCNLGKKDKYDPSGKN